MGMIQDRFRSKRNAVIAILGLDGAGKSSIVQVITDGGPPDDNPLPTIGYSVRTLSIGRYNVSLTEVGGGKDIRGVWPKYFAQCHGVIYVVDGTSDIGRIAESKEELRKVLMDNRMKCKPLLVLCNKADKPGCLGPANLIKAFDLPSLLLSSLSNGPPLAGEPRGRVWVCTCLRRNGRIDPRIRKSLKWLLSQVSEQWPTLSTRVEQQHQLELDVKEKERQERIRKRRERLEEEERIEREAILSAESNENSNDIVAGNSRDNLAAETNNHAITIVAEIETQPEVDPQEGGGAEGGGGPLQQDTTKPGDNELTNEGAAPPVSWQPVTTLSLPPPKTLQNQSPHQSSGNNFPSTSTASIRKTAKVRKRSRNTNKVFPEVTTTAPPLALKKPPLFGSWDSRLPIEDIDHDSHQCHQHIINDNDNTNKQTINNVTTLKEIPLPVTIHPTNKAVSFNLQQDVLPTPPMVQQ